MHSRRIALLGALTLLLASVFSTPGFPTSSSRDWVRCLQTCTFFAQLGAERCDADCTVIYSGDQAAISACRTLCNSVVDAQYKECRIICKIVVRDGGDYPPEP